MVHAALATVGQLAVSPAQDLLGLGSAARLNTPGTQIAANWRWQLPSGALTASLAAHWATAIRSYGRA